MIQDSSTFIMPLGGIVNNTFNVTTTLEEIQK